MLPPLHNKLLGGVRGDDKESTISISKLPPAVPEDCPEPLLSTPSSVASSQKIEAKNARCRKRDAFGQNKPGSEETPQKNIENDAIKAATTSRFTIGKSDSKSSTVARKLNMAEGKPHNKTITKKVSFSKIGNLSPNKQKPPSDIDTVVPFQKKGPLSPVKKDKIAEPGNKTASQLDVEKPHAVLDQLTPQQIKARIGQVRKLSDLKARIQDLNKNKNFANTGQNKHRRALFSPPKLSKDSVVTFEVEVQKEQLSTVSPISSPIKSLGAKASPRKPTYDGSALLSTKDMPLPTSFKFLSEVFRYVFTSIIFIYQHSILKYGSVMVSIHKTLLPFYSSAVDTIVGMKYNRREIIRVTEIKPAVQVIIRKTFLNKYLRQIRCVFPKAYNYTWEKILNRLGCHTSGEYELQMQPNLSYKETTTTEQSVIGGNSRLKLTPRDSVERLKIFKNSLFQIVKEYHEEFLKNAGFPLEQMEKITKWHSNFDVEEHCPEIDTVDFPLKPQVERITPKGDF